MKITQMASDNKTDIPPAHTLYGALRFHCYGYLLALSDAGLLVQLCDSVAVTTGPRRSPALVLLRLLEPTKGQLLSPSHRSRVAAELELALRHDIDPKTVLGFLYEVGNQTMILDAHSRNITPAAVERYRREFRDPDG